MLLSELLQFKGLIWAFAARDIKVKYTQTFLGVIWVLMTPIITVGVMTFVFGLMIKVPSDGLPYILFYLVAIVPWSSFVGVLSQSISSLELHSGLISKIYFPRVIIGVSYALIGSVDFLVGFILILVFAAYFGALSIKFVLLMPLLLFIQMSFALGLGFLLAPFNARYRDVKHITPLAIQLFYLANPIMYSVSLAPDWAIWLFKINPLATTIITYRSLLNGQGVDWLLIACAFSISLALLIVGSYFFMREAQDMVDVL